MIEVIASIFLVVVYFIIYLFSTGEDKKKAKAELKEIVSGTHEKYWYYFLKVRQLQEYL